MRTCIDNSVKIDIENARSPEWPIPQPLLTKVDPEPYPIDALPNGIRAAVEEVQGFTKAPMALVVASALAVLSVVAQANVDVKRADKLIGPISLFLLTIADSGERKSTCDGFFSQSIRDYEQSQAESAKSTVKNHKAAFDAWEVKYSGIKDKIRALAKQNKNTDFLESSLCDLESKKPELPRIPRLIYGDATPEALAYSLAKKWPSGGVISAEAGIVFGAHGMQKDSVMRNLSLLNILWDGGSLPIDRRTSESFSVRGVRLTVGIQVQEATLSSFFERSGVLARGTGFLARFLFSWPESTQGYRKFTEAPKDWPALDRFKLRIAAILNETVPIDEDGTLTPIVLPMSAEGKEAWVLFHDIIEAELVSGGELNDVRDVASKSADNVARLAALFHIFEGGISCIGLSAIESATRIVSWHLNESRRFFGELALPKVMTNAVRLDNWLIHYCEKHNTNIIPRREIQRHAPGNLRQREVLDSALNELKEADRILLVSEGRRKEIHLNPLLLNKRE